MELPTHECKSGSHFEQEFLHLFDKPQFNIPFIELIFEGQHIKQIGDP